MSPTDAPRRAQRQRVIFGFLRAVGIATVLVAVYYLAPLDLLTRLSLMTVMIVGLLILAAMTTYSVWAILQSPHPAVRAIEALASTVPLYLLLFAATYYLMSHSNPNNFNAPALTPTDTLYFTVTVKPAASETSPGQSTGPLTRHRPDEPRPGRHRTRSSTHRRRSPTRTTNQPRQRIPTLAKSPSLDRGDSPRNCPAPAACHPDHPKAAQP